MDPDQRKWSILNTQTGELNTPNYDGKAAGGVNTAFVFIIMICIHL